MSEFKDIIAVCPFCDSNRGLEIYYDCFGVQWYRCKTCNRSQIILKFVRKSEAETKENDKNGTKK